MSGRCSISIIAVMIHYTTESTVDYMRCVRCHAVGYILGDKTTLHNVLL